MKKRTFNIMGICVIVLFFLGIFIPATLYTPYEINHDQHMVDTVNKRAMAYEPANATLTDFAIAEILDNDAQLEYEERVWNLEHQELYYLGDLLGALAFIVCFSIAWIVIWWDITEQYVHWERWFEKGD